MFIVYATQSVVLCYISPKSTSSGPYKWEMPVKCLLNQIRLNCFNINMQFAWTGKRDVCTRTTLLSYLFTERQPMLETHQQVEMQQSRGLCLQNKKCLQPSLPYVHACACTHTHHPSSAHRGLSSKSNQQVLGLLLYIQGTNGFISTLLNLFSPQEIAQCWFVEIQLNHFYYDFKI